MKTSYVLNIKRSGSLLIGVICDLIGKHNEGKQKYGLHALEYQLRDAITVSKKIHGSVKFIVDVDKENRRIVIKENGEDIDVIIEERELYSLEAAENIPLQRYALKENTGTVKHDQ